MEHQLAGGACGVDIFRDALEGDALSLHRGDCLNEMLEGTAESIKPPDNEGISFPKV